jgi:hypothetical protein
MKHTLVAVVFGGFCMLAAGAFSAQAAPISAPAAGAQIDTSLVQEVRREDRGHRHRWHGRNHDYRWRNYGYDDNYYYNYNYYSYQLPYYFYYYGHNHRRHHHRRHRHDY